MSQHLHRPYSRIRGKRELSVTEVLEHLAKPGLPWGAAKETGIFAVLHPEKWSHLAPNDAIDVLRRHHRGIWDGRAAMGTLAHAVNEHYGDQIINGTAEEIDIVALIAHVIETDSNARTWKETNIDDLIEQAMGHVLGLEQWWADYNPDPILVEASVRTPGRYIGQTDMRARINAVWSDGMIGEQDCLIDVKTTAKQDEGSGIYLDSWTFQCNAYGYATERVFYEAVEAPELKSGYRVKEVGTEPWTPPERLAVLHLRGNEGYDFYEVPMDPAIHALFLGLSDVARFVKELPKIPGLIKMGALV